jgi:hypothetical protein
VAAIERVAFSVLALSACLAGYCSRAAKAAQKEAAAIAADRFGLAYKSTLVYNRHV